MKIDYEGPYRERRGITQELKAYIAIAKIIAITSILLLGIVTLNRLDTIMTQQAHIIKTQADAMDQLMWIRMDILVLEEQLYMLEDDVEALKPKITPQSYYPLTPEERDLVEKIVAEESRGEPIEGMVAVAQSIRDRSRLWGMTVTEVCLAPGQFGEPYQGEISPEVVQAVWAVFDEGMSAYPDPVTHFHTEDVSPYWTADKVYRGSIGTHRFYY